jgi:predicted DNA-binding protein
MAKVKGHSVNKPKKKMGRPATGHDPVVAVRLSVAMMDRIKRWARANGFSRSEGIRRLIERGLED